MKKKDQFGYVNDYFPPIKRLMYGEQHGRGWAEAFDRRMALAGIDLGFPYTLPAAYPGQLNIRGVDGQNVWHVFNKPGGVLPAITLAPYPYTTSYGWYGESPHDGEYSTRNGTTYGRRVLQGGTILDPTEDFRLYGFRDLRGVADYPYWFDVFAEKTWEFPQVEDSSHFPSWDDLAPYEVDTGNGFNIRGTVPCPYLDKIDTITADAPLQHISTTILSRSPALCFKVEEIEKWSNHGPVPSVEIERHYWCAVNIVEKAIDPTLARLNIDLHCAAAKAPLNLNHVPPFVDYSYVVDTPRDCYLLFKVTEYESQWIELDSVVGTASQYEPGDWDVVPQSRYMTCYERPENNFASVRYWFSTQSGGYLNHYSSFFHVAYNYDVVVQCDGDVEIVAKGTLVDDSIGSDGYPVSTDQEDGADLYDVNIFEDGTAAYLFRVFDGDRTLIRGGFFSYDFKEQRNYGHQSFEVADYDETISVAPGQSAKYGVSMVMIYDEGSNTEA